MPRPRPAPGAAAERLQKYLAQRGLGSRRVIEEWIRAQRISVNGRIAELGQKVTEQDEVRLDGRLIKTRASAAAQAFLFNRSPGDPLLSNGTRSARDADGDRAALVDRLPRTAGRRFIAVSQMPSIDGGLEVVTSDGALAEKLQRASAKLPCEFSVRVKALLGPDQLAGVQSGKLDRPARMIIDSLTTSEAELEGSNRWYAIVARGASGKDIRQLFERQGVLVSRILRVSMGALKLDKTLSRGQFRQLEPEDIDALLHPKAAESAADGDSGD
ncbi:MAG TPA: S4 domain-containing protein [Steroidobacteraceae bacterium]|nr:S4 domain-containing protein [Steroidobacteraceae bacterium]